MEFSIKTLVTAATILLTGLSAGLFFAWTVSIIPGTKRIPDMAYLETMQSINRAILNPAFFVIFIGPVFALIASSYLQWREGMDLNFWLVAIAAVAYIIGTFGVTAAGNVPLNDQLDVLNLAQQSNAQLQNFRISYETAWNNWHSIRTGFSVLSFVLLIWAIIR